MPNNMRRSLQKALWTGFLILTSLAGFSYPQGSQGATQESETPPQESQAPPQEKKAATQYSKAQPEKIKIIPFGYDIFRPAAEAVMEGPIDENYILSPGDQVVVRIWGQLNLYYDLKMTPERASDLANDQDYTRASRLLSRK